MSTTTPQKNIEKDLPCLSYLQSEMNLRNDLKASETLKIAESLYEKGIITYPRVDTTILPHNINEISKDLFHSILLNSTKSRKESIGNFFDTEKNDYKKIKSSFIENINFTENEVNIQNSAIIPTSKVFDSNQLSEKELFLYESIVDLFIYGLEKRI